MPAAAKWKDPESTAEGKTRAKVGPTRLEVLWFNTGTRCNLACPRCYMGCSPRDDRLSKLSLREVVRFLDEIASERLGTREIGFTGGEPFTDSGLTEKAGACLERGLGVLILTNATKPMMSRRAPLLELRQRYGKRLRLRVSLDHYTREVHERERGKGTWVQALRGARWLAENGFSLSVAGRALTDESDEKLRAGYGRLFLESGLPVRPEDPGQLVVFPEMDAGEDPPEITAGCWKILGKAPESVMCAASRMVVKRKGDPEPSVTACTLLPHDPRFTLGRTLKESLRPVSLLHPHCATFCVLGCSSCSP